MGFSFSKLFGKAQQEASSSDTIEAIIDYVGQNPYGTSDRNVMFAGLNELGGYFFFETVIVGIFNVKCKHGAQLTFKGDKFELTLDSDSLEFETNPTETKGRYVTNIDFQIEKSDIETLQKSNITSINLKVKKQDILFTKYVESKK
ncbi:MAG: hypothetical protein ED556_05675 [Winogradskyella sp.]|uniref:hypothetical protein n=1 Tax=Winogradskyella sp. TaxID=1883156 RepID=UPI000F3D3533|nr:hypothetical protein [Winogradskyella sp.]RNC86912.1 MAG: hypothetical protein ED556_05675 [Winogradskyella sp.]